MMQTPIRRNYGCRISEFSFKGLRTVVMENEMLRIGILVDKGTDIYEFLYKPLDIDCMWQSRISIRGWQPRQESVPSIMGPFLDFYFGGWQELFPNTGTMYCQWGRIITTWRSLYDELGLQDRFKRA